MPKKIVWTAMLAAIAAGLLPVMSVLAVAPKTTPSASRTFDSATVDPGGQRVVTITASNYGAAAGVTETLPAGFSYARSSLDDMQVTVSGQTVRFILWGNTSFTYTVTAPSTPGLYTFSGTLRDDRRSDHAVNGDSSVTVNTPPPRGAPPRPAAAPQQTTYTLTLFQPASGGVLDHSPKRNAYAEDDRVVVQARVDAGYQLTYWGGDCQGTPATSATCVLTMDHDKVVGVVLGRIALTCKSGTAVPNPSANNELVNDCRRLLALRDALGGTAVLNWTPGTAMTSWTGVTVGGSPRRATKLDLANDGLTGQVSGLVGELSGLTELRLNGNTLTGRLPSKLAQLTKLTHAYIAGNAFTGCVPPLLRTVTNNDVATQSLPDCPAPVDVSYYQGDGILAAGTYQFTWIDDDPPLIFDIPEGLGMRVWGYFLAYREEGPPLRGLMVEDAETGSWIGLDVREGVVYERHVEPTAQEGTSEGGGPRSAATGPSVATLFDRIGESLWIGSGRGK